MLTVCDLDSVAKEPKSILTIGTFDGVHLGHRILVQRLVAEAHAGGLRSVVVTFDPHPQTVVQPPRNPAIRILTTTEEKKSLLADLGIDTLVVARFDAALAGKSGEAFVKEVLLERIGMVQCLIGHDHAFGHRRSGSFETLQRLGKEYGFDVAQMPPYRHGGVVVKSTVIRECLAAGDVARANELLGWPYRLSGSVVRGDGRGRQLGFPTANIRVSDAGKLIPARGVYATRIRVGERWFPSVTNIGFRPTVSDAQETIVETHVLDFDQDIYGRNVVLELVAWLRGEQRFAGSDELAKAIRYDIASALSNVFTDS